VDRGREVDSDRDKHAIDQYVGGHFNPTGPSAVDIPLAVHLLVLQGTEVFTTHRSSISQNYLILSKTTF
jgi:hypothetical protein